MNRIVSTRFIEVDGCLVQDDEREDGARSYRKLSGGVPLPFVDVMAIVNVGNVIRHVLHAKQFSRDFLEKIVFPSTQEMRKLFSTAHGRQELRNTLRHRSLLSLFYEPSTRTRLSFEFAAVHLGMHLLTTENAAEFSSAIKGETIEDTARIVSQYGPDVIVIRHKEDGIVARAAEFSRTPIINGGDGIHQHPSQALLDVYTIFAEKKRIDGLTIAFGGDLKHGRTVRSLVYLLSKFKGVHFVFVSHEAFRIGDDLKEHLIESELTFEETDSVESALTCADVVYWTRVQKERMDEATRLKAGEIQEEFTIDKTKMTWMKQDGILLHPLPRIWEINKEVDKDPRAAYFRQAENGLFVRMALLKWVILGS